MATKDPTGSSSFLNARFKPMAAKYGNIALGYAGRLGNQKYMTAIRDAFAILIPLVIAAGFAVLIRNFVFGVAAPELSILGWIGFATGDTIKAPIADNPNAYAFVKGSAIEEIKNIGNYGFFAVEQAVFPYISLYIAFTLGYLIGNMRNASTPILNGFVGMAAFMATTLAKPALFGASGLLTSIVISILASEALSWLSKNKRLLIKMPDSVPPAVARAFARLFPALIVLFSIFLINLPFQIFGHFTNTASPVGGAPIQFGLADAFFVGVQAPFVQFASENNAGLGIALVYVLAVMLLWFFGLHGTNILTGIFSPLYTALQLRNLNEGGNVVFAGPTFDAFIWFGGAGVTLALVIAILLFGRRNKANRTIAALGVGPAVFNINEPIIFGLPLVLNVKWVVPFVLAPVLLTISTYLGFTIGNISPSKVVMPWVTPVGIGAFFVTNDWKAIILALINLAIAVLVYTPFVILWSRKQTSEQPVEMVGARANLASAADTPSVVSTPQRKRGRPLKARAQ